MSGYRTLHREHVDTSGGAVWSVASSPVLRTKQASCDQTGSNRFRSWVTGSTDGLVRGYVVEETGLQSDGGVRGGEPALDASAATVTLTHILEGRDQVPPSGPSIGGARVCTVRNYVGQDAVERNLIIVSLDLVGTLRVWEFDSTMDADLAVGHQPSPPRRIRARYEKQLIGACGTSLALRRPPVEGPVSVAIGMLDGTVAVVSTGLATPKYSGATAPTIGTIVGTRGSKGSAVALCLCWKPASGGANETLAIGRQDGTVDVISTTSRNHRLVRHTAPLRAIAYTPDGALLITGSDQGMVCVWDTSRPTNVALVHHLQTNSWILQIVAFDDSRRFMTCNQNRTLSVWTLDHPNQVTHTFASDNAVYSCCTVEGRPRIVAGSDAGWLQLYSIE
jgi:WD40 repeat protein